MTPLFVGAYAASPAHVNWDPAFENELLQGLAQLPGVTGIELPWIGGIHPHDPMWLLSHLPATLSVAITPLPWIVAQCHRNPDYGIASTDASGRAAALDDLEHVRRDAARLADARGREIDVMMLHTAPRGGRGDVTALRDSLSRLADRDWSGARLAIEHCDAATVAHPPEKGFLSLPTELQAIEEIPDVGIWMNWGRSAVELRDPDAVAGQIAVAASSGRLAGVAFSGASDTAGDYGDAWADAHLPIAEAYPTGDGSSLLTPPRLADALAASGETPRLGVKVSRRPTDHTVEAVLSTLAANVRMVRAAEAAQRCARSTDWISSTP